MPDPNLEYWGKDPRRMAQVNRNVAMARQQQFWDQAQHRVQSQEGLEDYYRRAAERMYERLDPIYGTPGYSPEEQEQIIREQELRDMQLTPEQMRERHIRPEEEAEIRSYFRPEEQEQILAESALGQRGGVDYARRAMEEAAWSPELELSERFAETYPMSEQERQDIISSAGMDVRDRYAAATDAIMRQAMAEGSGAPGMGVLRERFERQARGEAGDQMIRARMLASQEAANRSRAMEEMRLAAAQDAASRRAQAGYLGGQMQTEVEANIGQQRMENVRDIRDYGAEQGRYFSEQRRGTEAQIQQEDYNRRLNQNQILSQRYQEVAQQKKREEAEARQFALEQQRRAQEQRNAAASQQIQGYDVTQQGASQAAQTAMAERIDKKDKPSGAAVAAGAVLGGISGLGGFAQGGVVTRPTIALLGERGPEAVVPLTREANPRVPPRYVNHDYYSRIFRPGASPTVAELGLGVKMKYPGIYDDVPDDELGRRIRTRFPGAYDDSRRFAPPRSPAPNGPMRSVSGYAVN